MTPANFIPLAEETGLILAIGKWVLQTACAQSVAWQRAGLPPVPIAVNLSPRQLADPALVADVQDALRESGLRADLLELEVTESSVMHNVDRAVEVLSALKAMGVRLAIDDFGTGYSSLAQLKRFPIDTLKVDRSFVREIPDNPEDRAIAEAIIAMGKTLGLTVVAEGVETCEQEAFLRARVSPDAGLSLQQAGPRRRVRRAAAQGRLRRLRAPQAGATAPAAQLHQAFRSAVSGAAASAVPVDMPAVPRRLSRAPA